MATETVTIPKEEYKYLKEAVTKIELIEEVIHKPELLSEEAKQKLVEARATSRKEYIKDKEIEKEFS